jgi:hypothetical protein
VVIGCVLSEVPFVYISMTVTVAKELISEETVLDNLDWPDSRIKRRKTR